MLESEGDEEVEAVKKMKTLYQSCMDSDTVEELGAEPLLELIEETGEIIGSIVWNLSNQDTKGAEESVVVSEVSSFQRMQK